MLFSQLTAQERQCLILLHELGSAQAVATRLGLALSTVYNHHQRAMKKLGAPSALRAAQIYAAHLAEHGGNDPLPPSESSSGDDSPLGEGRAGMVSSPGIAVPRPEPPGGRPLREDRMPYGIAPFPRASTAWDFRPWRGKGEHNSRLTTGAKLGWIVGLACLLAITVLVLISVGASLTLIQP